MAGRKAGGGARSTRVGIGDDCAVLGVPVGREMLVTTDFSIEGVHFRRDWHPAESVGWRCLARGLSDIAAMGGEPRAAFLSLALPRDVPEKWVDGFFGGLLRLAKEYGVTLAGGDTAESRAGVLADIVVVGNTPRGKAVLRSGAQPGDLVYVSGPVGESAAAIERMQAGRKLKAKDWLRHFFPQPRIELGQILRTKRFVTAMIDLSDGLSTDLSHICEEGGVGAEIESEAIPRSQRASLEQALHGGEDYELLFTAPAGKRVPGRLAGGQLIRIGRITRQRGMFLLTEGAKSRLKPQGWEHFRA